MSACQRNLFPIREGGPIAGPPIHYHYRSRLAHEDGDVGLVGLDGLLRQLLDRTVHHGAVLAVVHAVGQLADAHTRGAQIAQVGR